MWEHESDTVMQRAREAFQRREYLAAIAELRDAVQENPGFADLRHLMGLCLSMLGQPENALEQFDRAIAENDCYIDAHLNRAITLNELGRYDEAREAFGRATDLEQGRAERFPAAVSAKLANAHLHVGDLYMAANAPAEAAEEYRMALGMRPRFTDIRNKLATALLQLGRLDEAEHELGIALEHNPRYTEARLNLGLARFRRGDEAGAREHWSAAREQKPDDPQVRAYWSLVEQP